jgi:hypothetical protein
LFILGGDYWLISKNDYLLLVLAREEAPKISAVDPAAIAEGWVLTESISCNLLTQTWKSF